MKVRIKNKWVLDFNAMKGTNLVGRTLAGRTLVGRTLVGRTRYGVASLDYVLVLAVVLPLATFLYFVVPRMIQLVYEFTITMIGSPFM